MYMNTHSDEDGFQFVGLNEDVVASITPDLFSGRIRAAGIGDPPAQVSPSLRLPSASTRAAYPSTRPTSSHISMAATSQTQSYDHNTQYPPLDTSAAIKSESEWPRDTHRRGYQACDPCRQRKVKCDLGSVDNPSKPPCLRCRREHKECFFSVTRRKRKSSQISDNPVTHSTLGREKRRLATSGSYDEANDGIVASHSYSVSPGHSIHTDSPQQWSSLPPQTIHTVQPAILNVSLQSQRLVPAYDPEENASMAEQARPDGHFMLDVHAAGAIHPAIATSHDALQLLSEAADQTEQIDIRKSHNRTGHLHSPSSAFESPGSIGASHARGTSNTMAGRLAGLIDPTMAGNTEQMDPESQAAARVWSRMRFVRAGWFSSIEAMAYIDYYYLHLAPLTPIVTPNFRPLSTHLTLLTEEPILAIALLAISSRHMKLVGPGAESRAYSIHDKLWTYLRCMVERLLWGQEQFGGGFFGGDAIKIRESKSGQISWKGSLRTIGTIEAILLLTDWHPRALHFPPGDDENRLLDADYSLLKDADVAKDEKPTSNRARATGRVAYSSWLEPAWRSDRMSWMLLGLAQALSFELGIFDKEQAAGTIRSDFTEEALRKTRVRRLVLVYVSQNSGRLGIPSMLPLSHWGVDPFLDSTAQFQQYETMDPIDIMQNCWLHIASIMYRANVEIFPSRDFTRDLTSSGQYISAIARFTPLLRGWKARFDQVSAKIAPLMRHILTMEYEYARCYINSLGLQKVVESWINISNEAATTAGLLNEAPAGRGDAPRGTGGVSFSLLLEIFKPNREYIEEVADAARSILKAVVEGLAPGQHLRHAPVRTYFRILSGLMFTLKRFSLGASEGDIRESLELLELTTGHLSKCVVDDVQLSSQTANLVDLLVSNIRKTFIRFAPTGGSEAGSREQSRHQTPHGQENIHQQPKQNVAPRQRQPNTSFGYKLDHSREDPLAGIHAQPMTTDFSNVTYMPPLNYNVYMNGLTTNHQPDSAMNQSLQDNDTYPADWFALPLDNIFNSTTGTVDQGFGGIGPTVGDKDMLELLTNEQYDQWNGAGPSLPNGF